MAKYFALVRFARCQLIYNAVLVLLRPKSRLDMRIYFFFFLGFAQQFFLLTHAHAQDKIFNTKFENYKLGSISSIKQDKEGYIWFSAGLGADMPSSGGIYKYDGHTIVSYLHDANNSNSLASNWAECLYIDPTDMIWIGTMGGGLDKFDPVTNTFTHYRHDAGNVSSLSNDSVQCIIEDEAGQLWIGTKGGLNVFDEKSGKFRHFKNDPANTSTISNNDVRVIYEDHQETLWIGCGSTFSGEDASVDDGGLNRFDRTTGKFTRYKHDPRNPFSIANNKVRSIFEDSRGNLWIGTGGDGLHTLDRKTGKFTHYSYDAGDPEKLSRPFFDSSIQTDAIVFIKEDPTGAIWIGSYRQGINKYNPVTGRVTHYGVAEKNTKMGRTRVADTTSGLSDTNLWDAFISKDGMLWVCSLNGYLANADLTKSIIPYFSIKANVYSFYFEAATNILWLGTEQGLMQKNLGTKAERKWVHDPQDPNSLIENDIYTLRPDAQGKLWIATDGGLNKFDPVTNTFTSYWPDKRDPSSMANHIYNLLIDGSQNLWLATGLGLYRMDHKTGNFTSYVNSIKDSHSLSRSITSCLAEDRENKIWVGTISGINSLDIKTGKFQRYLEGSVFKSIFVDGSGVLWAGADDGLYRFDHSNNSFSRYVDINAKTEIINVLHIMEDDARNLWVATTDAIVRLNPGRDTVRIYGENYGVHGNTFPLSHNFKAANGELFFGDQAGYYEFFPDRLSHDRSAPHIVFTSFKLGNDVVKPGKGGIITKSIWETSELKLNYKQNVFSFEFVAIDYKNVTQSKCLFKLENYDNSWRPIGNDHKVYLFNIPPGKYILHVRAINADGLWGDKEISIIISPPWYKTWWAYTIFVLAFISSLWTFIFYRSRKLRKQNSILEERVKERTLQLQTSLENLKSTQAQLVQQEKMASLGELTAGIAHEIQNPLNFVNNFSEINSELVDELKSELAIGNTQLAVEIADSIKDNEQKIIHHGKRADAIVKGMLQHSRASTGQRELTDINALADEYLRLAYHGLRAKDKSFNAKFEMDLDKTIERISVVPQDIGRVLLNLINNAFYAVDAKKRQLDGTYEPCVSITTRKTDGKVEVKVKDNGNGVPQKLFDKIFQPFFTTKPTGQGTGLGLSLSYDIVKAHGGEIKVQTREGEGAEFVIIL